MIFFSPKIYFFCLTFSGTLDHLASLFETMFYESLGSFGRGLCFRSNPTVSIQLPLYEAPSKLEYFNRYWTYTCTYFFNVYYKTFASRFRKQSILHAFWLTYYSIICCRLSFLSNAIQYIFLIFLLCWSLKSLLVNSFHNFVIFKADVNKLHTSWP